MRIRRLRRARGGALVAGSGVSVVARFLETVDKASRPQGEARASSLWFLASVAALGGPVACSSSWPRSTSPSMRVRASSGARSGRGARFSSSTPIQNNRVNGQINFQVWLLELLCLRGLLRGRGARAALFRSAAVSITITPALLWLFATVHHRWTVVVVCGVATAVLSLAPLLVLGLELLRYDQTFLGYVLPFAARGPFPAPHGVAFSLNGLVTSLLGGSAGPVASQVLSLGLAFGGLAVLAGGTRRKGSPGRDVGTFAADLLVIRLATPFSEVHHLEAPAASLAGLVALSRPGRPRHRADSWSSVSSSGGGHVSRAGPVFLLATGLLLAPVAAIALGRPEPVLSSADRRRDNGPRVPR